jgi:hypothetical protein
VSGRKGKREGGTRTDSELEEVGLVGDGGEHAAKENGSASLNEESRRKGAHQ